VTRPKINEGELLGDIKPDQIYRVNLGAELFGYGPQSIRDKIKSGELPQPFPLSAGARFEAWLGRDIISHREAMQAEAAAKAKALRERPPQPQPQPAALRGKVKIKKTKLRPPAQRAAAR
jgi:predicted DNA-binding transcriptional regulator AlpA